MPDEPNRGEMPFLDHVEELRWRILRSLLAVVLATLVGWVVVERIDVIGLLIKPIAPLVPGGRLKFTSPTEPFFITLKFAFVIGILLASPYIIYQAWAFLSPALYQREKRMIVPALSAGVVLFVGGAAAAYCWVLPRALRVLMSFQQGVLEPIITANNYFGFAAQIIVAFGLITELPLVVVILAVLGVVTPEFLARNRRYAIVISAIAAALLSPPDAVSMVLMMVPLWLLYEVSIFCAWLVTRRRARRQGTVGGAALLVLLWFGPLRTLGAQGVSPAPSRPDTAALRRGGGGAGPRAPGQPLDTATARKLGLPAGPTRSFPTADPIMDSLLKLKGFRVTRYVADSLIVRGDSQAISLRGEAYLEREGTKLEADSVHYRQESCRLDAGGSPRLFESGTVMVGDRMRYDTCIRRGVVDEAFTDFNQGGVTWYTRGNLAVDSGSTRLYGASSKITSDDQPVPDYHFATGELKWLNKKVMVARPAVLYVRDVPILWLPFIFQDIRPGPRSGILIPRFGINDLVRPTGGYERHFANIGYYAAVNPYLDLLGSFDWYANRNITLNGQLRYHWLDRFLSGSIRYSKVEQLDVPGNSATISWQHTQAFDSRTHLNMSINYVTNGTVLQQNSVDPFLSTASINSQLNFDKRFDWGTFTVGGSRRQDLSTDVVQQTFPQLSLTPSPVNLGANITWSPGFSFSNQQNSHSPAGVLPLAGVGGASDSVTLFADSRTTTLGVQTPLRIGRWNWSNSLSVTDQASDQRVAVDLPAPAVPGGRVRAFYGSTFSTAIDWQTGINLPQLFSGTWKLQPGFNVVNATSAGPFLLRNQYTNGGFLEQGKRAQLSLGLRPTWFGFFPGFGPLARIRHSFSPIIDYFYAPSAHVSDAFARAIDPTGKTINARSDPQQTIVIGLSQNFEGKLRASPKDTGQQQPRKLRLLSINTDAISYNFEQAKQPGHNGWQTQTIGNTFASDLVPNFSLRIVHDLWTGPVGYDSSRFSPFLTNLNASFAFTPTTLRGIAHLFGLGKAPPQAPPPPPATQPTQGPAPPITGAVPSMFGGPAATYVTPGGLGAGGGQGFSLSTSYSVTRVRSQPQPQQGQEQLSLNLSFKPTAKWQASWTTVYDVVTQQFGEHFVRLERDLHRWHASFAFVKSPNGNFAFTFYVNLLDDPDIKFNYEQQTVRQ